MQRTTTLRSNSNRVSMNNINVDFFGVHKGSSKAVEGFNPVISHNDGKVIKMATSANKQELLSASDLAAKGGLSIAYVYAELARRGIEPTMKDGRKRLYDQSAEAIFTKSPRKRRARRAAPQMTTVHTQSVVPPQQADHIETLLDRIARLEAKIKSLSDFVGM